MRSIALAGLVVAGLAGCASTPQVPQETPLTLKLNGTAVEVQHFIEERVVQGSGGRIKVDSANDRAITFKTHCNQVPNYNAFRCAAIMMAVGNSRWDGPYAVLNFRTAEIRGVVHLSASSEWCATNAFGKTNCMPDGNTNEINEALSKIAAAFESKTGQ